MKFKPLIPGVICTLLAGCVSNDYDGEEFILPKMQQNTYLSHAVPPQQFGFSVYPTAQGVGMMGTARLHPRHLASKTLKKGGLPVIEMRGRAARIKFNALLDTSSPDSWMEFSTSQELDTDFLGVNEATIPYRGTYNTGGVDAYAAVVSQMRIDQLFIENTPLYVRMAINSLGPLARGVMEPPVDAIIGYDVLSLFEYVQFDIDKQTVSFSASIPYIPHEDLIMTEAKIVPLRNFGLAVEGAILGEEMPIILDFAGDFHFARGDKKVSTTTQVSLGEVVYRKVPTLLLPATDSPPRAGRRMLEKYIITICGKKGVVYFERIPQ